MSVAVFLSSTREDMHTHDHIFDLRRAVLGTIRKRCMCNAMEDWSTDFNQATTECRKKIDSESSHFIGIFSHRRGWTPNTLGKSITEAEFDWANDKPLPMAIFLPEPGSPIDRFLQENSTKQTPEEDAAQKAFLTRVRSTGKSFNSFNGEGDLCVKVDRRLDAWNGEGPRDSARAGDAMRSGGGPGAVPTIGSRGFRMGRDDQMEALQKAQRAIVKQGGPEVAAFLVHGRPDACLRDFVEWVSGKWESESKPAPSRLAVSVAPWTGNDLGRLLDLVSESLETEWNAKTVQELAGKLREKLVHQDVILEIHDIHWYSGELPALLEQFWSPLAKSIPAGLPRRFTALLTYAKPLPVSMQSLHQDPAAPGSGKYDPAFSIALPELGNFETVDIYEWLRAHVPGCPTPMETAKKLFDDTGGGVPTVVKDFLLRFTNSSKGTRNVS